MFQITETYRGAACRQLAKTNITGTDKDMQITVIAFSLVHLHNTIQDEKLKGVGGKVIQ